MQDDHNTADTFRCLKVLVVEDEALIAMDIEMMLKEHGHTPLGPVCSVDMALCMLEKELPDIGLLDANLNGETIVPVAERLCKLNIPFVLLSAYNNFDFDESDLLNGAENIGKPFDERRLIEGLKRAIAP